MKRAGIVLTLLSVMVFAFAGMALAALIEGNDRPNTLVGTPKGDTIYGGADSIEGRGGGDALRLGGGRDEAYGSVATTLSVRWTGAGTTSPVALALIAP